MKKDPSHNGNQLGNLLARYQKIFKPPQASVERVCLEVIEEVCGIALKPHQVEYVVATRTLQLKTPSIIRSEVLSHSNTILAQVAGQLDPNASPTTIL